MAHPYLCAYALVKKVRGGYDGTVRRETRRHARYAATLTVQVERDGARRFATIFDISLGGAFLEMASAPSVGEKITVIVMRQGRKEVRLTAEVRYYASANGRRGMDGVGLAWKGLDSEGNAFVAVLVERAQAGKPLRDDL